MTLESLRCLSAIIDTQSFRAAAERLHRSQPAVSQQLKSLEREVGHSLIDRKTGRPTAMGELIHSRAVQILQSVESLAHEVADYETVASRELRVGTSDTTALYVLPPLVREFATRMPETRVVLVNRSSDAIAEQVHAGDLDLGIVTLPVDAPELEEAPLFQQRFVLVVPREHPLARKRRVALETLKDEPFVLLESATRTGTLIRRYFAANDFTPQITVDSGSFEVIKRFVAEGVGISILPDMVVGAEDKNLRAIPMNGFPEAKLGAIWRKGTYQSKAQRAFVAMLQEQ